jgi:hypothetical protein
MDSPTLRSELTRPAVIEGNVFIALTDEVAAILPVHALRLFAERYGVLVPISQPNDLVH